MEPTAGPVLRGYRGRLVWWALWWPFGLPVSLLCVVLSILGDGDGGFGSPRRVIWRDDSGRAHLVFRGMEADGFQVLVPGWGPRLVTALVGLHQACEPIRGSGSRRLVRAMSEAPAASAGPRSASAGWLRICGTARSGESRVIRPLVLLGHVLHQPYRRLRAAAAWMNGLQGRRMLVPPPRYWQP